MTLKKWMGTRRYVYNKVLETIKSKKEKVNFYSLRNKYVIAKNNPLVKEWETETPKDIRAGAISDLVKNHSSAFSRLKQRQITKFNMNYCSKKDAPSIEVPKSAIKIDNKDFNGIFMYKRYIPDKIKVAKGENLDISIDCDCRLKVENNVWLLCVPIKVEAKKKIPNKEEWCSIDPGVRTFNTVYSENMILKIKVNADKVKLLHDKIDKFKSMRDKKIIKRKRLRRRERKAYFKINNLIDELHFKTISYLTKTFNYIILPIFESQEMSKKIRIKGVNRNLLQLKHFLFKERLKSKCMLEKTYLDICTEEYTTKTCGNCGNIKDVGFSSVYSCLSCGVVIDRDVNGARNIGIKRMSEMS
jgi:putative transposase